jgi:hypothetical protein
VRKLISRSVGVEHGLVFDYEVSPHRVFLVKAARQPEGAVAIRTRPGRSLPNEPATQLAAPPHAPPDSESATDGAGRIGGYVPFKQSRLTGQTNPLRPPLHVETVLIGRALGQRTGYCFGLGFRIRDDGYVEAEFADRVRKFETYEQFEREVASLQRHEST